MSFVKNIVGFGLGLSLAACNFSPKKLEMVIDDLFTSANFSNSPYVRVSSYYPAKDAKITLIHIRALR